MAYKITYTRRFEKNYKKLTSSEKWQIKTKVEILSENPSHPSLLTKRIQGTDDLFECSVNMDIRIIWYYEGDQGDYAFGCGTPWHLRTLLTSMQQ